MKNHDVGLLTIDEAAALLSVPKSWLYERTRTNSVPHIKLGKYLRFDQQEFLAVGTTVPARRPRAPWSSGRCGPGVAARPPLG